jgi:hypothetical protein
MQIAGATIANIAEVEAATKALRITPRPFDVLGEYSVAGNSGIMAAQITTTLLTPIWSFRWGVSGGKVALMKRIQLSAGNNGTGFVASEINFFLAKVISFSASDSGGTSLTPPSGQNKRRTSMPDSVVSDIRIASTAALTVGTRIFDGGDAIASTTIAVTTVNGDPMLPPTDMWDAPPGEFPHVLAQNEGLILAALLQPTGTWKFGVKVDWAEANAYP